MFVKISFLKKEQEVEIEEESTVSDILKEIKLNPQTVIVSRQGEIIPDTEKVKNGDKLEAIRVVSGG